MSDKHPLDGIAVGVEFEGNEYYFKPQTYITAYDLAIITAFLLSMLADRGRKRTADTFGNLTDAQRRHFERRT